MAASEGHTLDSVALRAGALGDYQKATEPSPKQYAQVKPKGTKQNRVGRLIIGEAHESTAGSPKEQTIKLGGGHERPQVHDRKKYERWKARQKKLGR